MNKTDIFDKLQIALAAFHEANGVHEEPLGVYLTQDIETAILSLNTTEVGNLAKSIFLNGARDSVKSILGFKILTWDSDHLFFAKKETPKKLSESGDRQKWKKSRS
jgi:hypothetical protein